MATYLTRRSTDNPRRRSTDIPVGTPLAIGIVLVYCAVVVVLGLAT